MRPHDRIRAAVLLVSILAVMSFIVHISLTAVTAKAKHSQPQTPANQLQPNQLAQPQGIAPAQTPNPPAKPTASESVTQSPPDPFRPVLPDSQIASPATFNATNLLPPSPLQGKPGQPMLPNVNQMQVQSLDSIKVQGVVIHGKATVVLQFGDTHWCIAPGDSVPGGYVLQAVSRDGATFTKAKQKIFVGIGESMPPSITIPN